MSPEFRSLLKKEWAERRSLFLWGLVVVAYGLGYCVAYEFEYRTRALIAAYYSTCLMMSPLAAVLLAMSTATGEYSKRTLKFSSSLPVPLSKVGWARLLGAWGCLVVPIVFGAIVLTPLFAVGLFEQAGLRMDQYQPNYLSLPDRPSLSRLEAIGFLWTTTAISVAYALHLSTLLSLVGTRCRNEGTVGFIGAIVVLFSLIFTTARSSLDSLGLYFASDWIGGLLPASLAINWGYAEGGGSSYTDLELAPLIFGPITVNLLITAGLAMWFTRWYGCRVDSVSRPTKSWRRWLPRLGMPAIAARLGIRWPGRLAALTWLNARQSVPLSVSGLMLAILITWVSLFESQVSGTLRVTQHGGTMTSELMGQLPSNTWFVGVLWSAIVAVGVFSSELKPGLEQFWRSRPISSGAWFWMKFSVGLIAVVGTLDLIPVLLSWSVPRQETIPPQSGPMSLSAYLACMPLIHAQVYAVAVTAVCRLRRSIPAAIVALVAFFVIDSVVKSVPGFEKFTTMDVFNDLDQAVKTGKQLDLTSAGYPLVYGMVVAIIIGAAVLARRTLLPPRAARRITATTAILFALCYSCCPANGQAAEPPTVADILAGIKQREALVKSVRMRVSSTVSDYKPLAHIQHQRRRKGLPVLPVTEVTTFEWFKRDPCLAYTSISTDGAVRSATAFDGTLCRKFSTATPKNCSRFASTRPLDTPFVGPESVVTTIGGSSLLELLETQKVSSITQRDVDGEKLIDFTMITTIDPDTGRVTNGEKKFVVAVEHRYQVTINASRSYWPVHSTLEATGIPDGLVIVRHETTTEGWIDAGPIVYPRKIRKVSSSDNLARQKHLNIRDNSLVGSFKLEIDETNETEILEIAVNPDLPDSTFAPAFPVGSVIYDQQDSKQYEVTADGTEQPYIAKPKGTRGAVFGYHLLWIAATAVWLFRRNASV